MTRPGTVTAALPAEVVARLGADGSLTVEEQRFALVPEWMIDAQVTDTAFRLYAVLLRYGGSSGRRMPSRALLARRLHRSVDTVDRALRELETYAIVRVERRRDGRQNLTNCYHLRTTDPAAPSPARTGGGRSAAATTPHASVPEQDGAREGRGSSAATPPPNGAAGRGAAG